MARYCISKGDLDKDGNRKLIAHIMDANGEWREELFERIPDSEADARIEALVNGSHFERWPPTP